MTQRSLLVASDGESKPIELTDVAQANSGVRVDIINFDETACIHWLKGLSGIPGEACQAMHADESRPRSVSFDGGLLVVLRGINRNRNADPEDMISVRLWLSAERLIIAKRRELKAISGLMHALQNGQIEGDAHKVFLHLLDLLGDQIGDYVDDVEERVGALDALSEQSDFSAHRLELSQLRGAVAAVRRYLHPQRDALDRLSRLPATLADNTFGRAMAERADRMTRYVEDLDLMRERLTFLREEVAAQIAAEQNARMYLLAIITTIFLPLGVITGLFGINVAGMPLTDNALGFAYVVLGMIAAGIGIGILLWWRRWF